MSQFAEKQKYPWTKKINTLNLFRFCIYLRSFDSNLNFRTNRPLAIWHKQNFMRTETSISKNKVSMQVSSFNISNHQQLSSTNEPTEKVLLFFKKKKKLIFPAFEPKGFKKNSHRFGENFVLKSRITFLCRSTLWEFKKWVRIISGCRPLIEWLI